MPKNNDPRGAAPRVPAIIKDYHARIYYDPARPASAQRASRTRRRAFPRRGWTLARRAGRAASALDVSGCVPARLLASLLPWLMLNRDGLTVLLHPGTGDAYADHTAHAHISISSATSRFGAECVIQPDDA